MLRWYSHIGIVVTDDELTNMIGGNGGGSDGVEWWLALLLPGVEGGECTPGG